MKIKILIYIMVSILAGYLVGSFLFSNKANAVVNTNIAYFIQDGVYTDSSSFNTKDYSKILVQEDDKYYSYVGITLSSDNANKIKEYYDYIGTPTYIKEVTLNNPNFISSLSEYDNLLSSSNGEEMLGILKVILATYEEIEHIS